MATTALLTPLGVVAAMPMEARWLGNDPALNGKMRVMVSGIGRKPARAAACALVEEGACALVSWGVAAGLHPELTSGSLILATSVRDGSGRVWNTDRAWRERLRGCLESTAVVNEGPLASATMPLATEADKRTLGIESGAVAADMESAAIAAVATEYGVPFLIVRAIVDTVHDPISPAIMSGLVGGEVHLRRILYGLLRHPSELLAFFRLAQRTYLARRSLTVLVRRAGPDLALPAH